eukprot:TRINITY_DN103087_c0_g1_i1.p1 TRINITY_DN103087_c0_g1~~TRINITY_DN103087_c0_g1_i1.p1  ORF type:complete len:408 (-),score=33.98 TRINITY_DN103087_c0_g1_i1:24-1226(-)
MAVGRYPASPPGSPRSGYLRFSPRTETSKAAVLGRQVMAREVAAQTVTVNDEQCSLHLVNDSERPREAPKRCCGAAFEPVKVRSMLLGQAISLLITGTGVFSSLLAADGIDIPVLQSFLNYFFLAFHIFWAWGDIRRDGFAVPSWRYALWALVDVEANFLVVWAYQYTSVASVMLLDGFAIPASMLLSYAVLGARYSVAHIVACVICIGGLVLTVVSDLAAGQVSMESGERAWFGDVLVLCGAALYGLSNVLQELYLKSGQRRCESLGMLGIFGTLISCVQAAILERDSLAKINWTAGSVVSLLGFQLCLFLMYVSTSKFLTFADAALFNLSLLTSDLYSVIFSWRVMHHRVTGMYCAAFVATVSGLVLYHTRPVVTTLPDVIAEDAQSLSRSDCTTAAC